MCSDATPAATLSFFSRWSPVAVMLMLLSLLFSSFSLTHAYQYTPLHNNAASNNGTCLPPYRLNWISGTSAGQVLLPRLVYPACATSNHQLPTLSNARTGSLSFLYGGNYEYNRPIESTMYVSNNSFSSLLFPSADLSSLLQTSWGGMGAITAQQTMILLGGRVTTSATSINTQLFLSQDHGQNWETASPTSGPTVRYETPMISIPFTNNLLIIAGYDRNAAVGNAVYLSQDGFGEVWTLQSALNPLQPSALGAAVALCDSLYCHPDLYSTPNSTVIYFAGYSSIAMYFSYDLGRTFSRAYSPPFASSISTPNRRSAMTAVSDTDCNIIVGGMSNQPDARFWLSQTKGQTWSILQQTVSIPGASTSLQFQYTLYNCMGFTYNPVTLAKRIFLSGYDSLFSDGSAYESLVGELDVPNNVTGFGLLPNVTLATVTPASVLPSLVLPACAYQLHSLTSGPMFLSAGGRSSISSFASSSVFSSSDARAFSNASTALPVALFSAGAAVLSNGNVLVFGGQLNNSVYSSSVYVSSNNGASFTLVTSNAAFGARANFVTCVQPGSNSVILIGGSLANSSSGTFDASVWLNFDGTGLAWQQIGVLPESSAQGACIFLYDNSHFLPTSASINSTLLVATHRLSLYRSYSMGASFSAYPSLISPGPAGYQYLPFATAFDATSTRFATRLVADYDNFIYAFGGQDISDNSIYFSGDLGFTFYALKQTNLVTASSFLIAASTSCLALNYASINGAYIKQLVLYSGQGVVFSDGSSFAALTLSVDAAPSFLPSNPSTAPILNSTQMSALYNKAQVTCPLPASTPTLQWRALSNMLPSMQMAACGRDVHHVNSSSSSLYLYGGFQNGNAAQLSQMLYASTTGFSSLSSITHNETVVPALAMSYLTVMPSGDLLLLGGVNASNAISNRVFRSRDGGQTFSLSSSSFPLRLLASLVSFPYSNTLLLIGGQDASNTDTSTVFINNDGVGSLWQLQSAQGSSTLLPGSAAASVALYDSSLCNPSLYSSPNATLLVFSSNTVSSSSNGASALALYLSYDLGNTFTVHSNLPFALAFQNAVASSGTPAQALQSRPYFYAVADVSNAVFVWGLSNSLNLQPEPTVWASFDKGQTFLPLAVSPSSWSVKSAALEVYAHIYGCGALIYSQPDSITGQSVRQLVSYGYQVYVSDASVFTAAVADLLNVPVASSVSASSASLPPTASLQSTLPSSSGLSMLGAACAYDVHSRDGVMLAMGGNRSDALQNATIFTASTASFASNASLISYSLATLPAMTGAGLSVLYTSQLLLYFGGQSVATGALSNAVFSSSTTRGIEFTPRGFQGQAAFSPRADFITCTAPFTNFVLVLGGVGSSGILSDSWASQDGSGAAWLSLPPGPWQSEGIRQGACVFLYDSIDVPNSASPSPFSTLLVFSHTSKVYRSLTGAQSWVTQPNAYTPLAPPYQIAPWSAQADATGQRLHIRVVSDIDNQIFAMAGSNINDNTLWWSQDQAFTWLRLTQRNALASSLLAASYSCLALNYRVLSGSNPNTFNKTLVLYSGNIVFENGAQFGALNLVLNGMVFNDVSTTAFDAIPFNSLPPQSSSSAPPASSSSSTTSSSTVFASSSSSLPSSSAGSSSSQSASSLSSSSIVSSLSSSSHSSSSSSSSSHSSTAQPDASSSSSSALSAGQLAGVVIGSVVGGLLLLWFCVCMLYICCSSRGATKLSTMFEKEAPATRHHSRSAMSSALQLEMQQRRAGRLPMRAGTGSTLSYA